ncbi:glycosyltransferase family 4 protein [Guptibacillus hwajinpoensis]|uniref:glycosyltransferase family 4 protein n=1 Tax=Guptibacillus hwajinpoensis TaxID=208199 RepID=UPI003D04C748
MRVLFLNGDHPWEGQDGYYKLTRQILDMISVQHEVHLLSLTGSEEIAGGTKHPLASLNVLFKVRKNKKASQIRSVISRESMVTWQFKHKDLLDKVNKQIDKLQPDLIIFNHIRSAWLAPLINSYARKIYIAHNAEAHAIGSISTNETGLMKQITKLESGKLRKLESDILEGIDTCVTLTAEDQERLALLCSNLNFEVIPPPITLPSLKATIRKPNLLLVGSYKWYPKRKNALWLAEEVLPRVANVYPGITLKFVGEGASLLEEEIGKKSTIEYYSDVPEIAPYLANGDIFLVPERQEGGIKIKTLEAASYGLPIVATKAGMEGSTLINGKNILQANTAQEFADQITYLLQHTDETTRIASEAHMAIKESFQASHIQQMYEELLQSHRVLEVVR